MKRAILGVITILFLVLNVSAQKKLEAFFTLSTFSSPESGPYVETYLSFNSSTLKYKPTKDGFQGSVEVTYIFHKEGKIDSFKKYNILSPVITDTTHGLIDFVDIQQLPIPNGTYNFEISIKDLNREMKPFSGEQELIISFLTDSAQLSDITLLKDYKEAKEGEFSKSGINFTPYMTDFYPDVQNRLIFYSELYNTDKKLGENTPFLVKAYIKDYHSEKILNNWTKYRKYNSNSVVPILDEFNIEKLPSGNYQFVIEAVDKENQLIDKKVVFLQRSNPKLDFTQAELNVSSNFLEEIKKINNRDSLLAMVKCLEPIADNSESQFIHLNYKTQDLGKLQSFFINFWTKRHPDTPGEHWVAYKKNIDFVDEHYSTLIKRGYETDRGQTYLKYGKPNHITDRQNEPSSYPYIIWHYYNHPKKSNAKYIFYNPDLVTNEYELLHSTVPGEINNYRWQYILQKRNTNQQSLDRETGDEHWGGRASDFFNNPR